MTDYANILPYNAELCKYGMYAIILVIVSKRTTEIKAWAYGTPNCVC